MKQNYYNYAADDNCYSYDNDAEAEQYPAPETVAESVFEVRVGERRRHLANEKKRSVGPHRGRASSEFVVCRTGPRGRVCVTVAEKANGGCVGGGREKI